MLQPFDLATIAPTPWKNGGGSTREVACWPTGASMQHFVWRISVAQIAQSGPFSSFEGVDRTIALLQGDGVQLNAPEHGLAHTLDQRWQPWPFAGDVALHCTLLGGPSQDLNVMVRRGCATVNWQTWPASTQALPAADAGMLLVVQGAWRHAGRRYTSGQGVWWDAPAPSGAIWQAESEDAVALCIAIALQEGV